MLEKEGDGELVFYPPVSDLYSSKNGRRSVLLANMCV